VVGWMLAHRESADLARRLIRETVVKELAQNKFPDFMKEGMLSPRTVQFSGVGRWKRTHWTSSGR
jgi:hypothetical protein